MKKLHSTNKKLNYLVYDIITNNFRRSSYKPGFNLIINT